MVWNQPHNRLSYISCHEPGNRPEPASFSYRPSTVLGATGVVLTAVPFVSSMEPSAKVSAQGAPVGADISKIESGALIKARWRGEPIWIMNRSQSALAQLPKNDPQRRDPHSGGPQQPTYCKNANRSIKPETFVLVPICTHLGCIPCIGTTPVIRASAPTGLAVCAARVMVHSTIWPSAYSRMSRQPSIFRYQDIVALTITRLGSAKIPKSRIQAGSNRWPGEICDLKQACNHPLLTYTPLLLRLHPVFLIRLNDNQFQ